MTKLLTIPALVLFLLGTPARALINPNFTPVQLIQQATAIWEAKITLDADAFTLTAVLTDTLKGEALAETAVLDFSDSDYLLHDLEDTFEKGDGKGMFITGDFSGASMDGGDVDEQPWAMLKVGTQWLMIASGEDKPFVIREDPIDLTTVWAGDPANFRQVTEYILADPRATVPVATGARWAEEKKLFDLDGTITGMDSVTLGSRTIVVIYRAEGDRVLDPENDFEDITETLGLASASAFAAWGRFRVSAHPSMASITPEGELILFKRGGDSFDAISSGYTFDIDTITGITAVARAETAALLIGTTQGMILGEIRENAWHPIAAYAFHSDAGTPGPVAAIDLNNDGNAELIQAGQSGLQIIDLADAENPAPHLFPYRSLGNPLSITPADFNGNGHLDLLIGGERGAALLLNQGELSFREALETTGELAYNIRPGIHTIGIGDHALDGRTDLVLFNRQLPPQVYFNRGFAVFGYDMELDLIEDVPDAQAAAGTGQQAGLLADLTGNGLQELLMVTNPGEVWLLTRNAEATTPLGATLTPPATLTGPVPMVIRDGNRVIGARIIAPHAPAHIGRRNRGPVTLSWRLPGETADREQRLIILRQETHALSVD